jgi:hypothetical protein
VTAGAPIRVGWAAFVAALLGLLMFAPALANGFAYDDIAIVAQDARIRSLANLPTILTTGWWAEPGHGLYRPLTTLSFALDWSLAPGSAAWFHLTNALLHAAASALVVLLLACFFAPAAALFGGLVFALHPVHVEAVANVVGRADVLASVFVLAACVLWTAEHAHPSWRGIRAAAVAALFACALLAKESAVMLPALLLLLDAARGAVSRHAVREYLRREATAFSALAVTLAGFLALRASVLGGLAPSRLDPAVEVAASTGERLLTALQAWPHYLRLLAFPRTLLADYGPRVLTPADGVTAGAALGALLLLGAVGGGLVALARGRHRLALGLLWFALAILPVSNLLLPIGVLVAERTLYLPSFAASVAAAGAAAAAGARAGGRRAPMLAARVAAAAVVALLAARTLARVPEWRSTERIMAAQLRDRPDSFRAQWALARQARLDGDATRALERYAEAMRLWPYRERLALESAGFAAESGQRRMAFQLASFAAQRWPGALDAQRLLAGTALDLGDTTTARLAVRTGLRLDPRDDVLRRMDAAMTLPIREVAR